jgi:nucleoside-diphosphate-sugar epimerase
MTMTTIFMSGATGLIGRRVAALIASPSRRIYTLSRNAPAGGDAHWLQGNLMSDGLGLSREQRARLAREVTTVIHVAANTSFSQTLGEARLVNTDGTRRLLELSADFPNVSRWVYVSTAFVAGLRTGSILEIDAPPSSADWANAYEQSKAEAEQLVRSARADWVIARPATLVCDDLSGAISQHNAVHRALRLYFGGLAAMLPGTDASRVDVITAEYAARGIALAAITPALERCTLHLCAGVGAMPLDELLDATYDIFRTAPAWRRKGIARPVRTDLDTYRLFEQAAMDVGSQRVRQALRSLGHFVPQLAYPKIFDTDAADRLLGGPAPSVASYWRRMVDHLVGNVEAREAA